MKQINPNLLKLAQLTYNPSLKIDESILEEKADVDTNAPNLDGFKYIPSINLYVAKERTLHNLNWYQAHEELNKQNLQMPTIPEFIEFLKYLKANPSDENTKIYNEITEVREPWRAEWLDADFKYLDKNGNQISSDEEGNLYINYNHRTVNGESTPKDSEPLEDCLMEDRTPGINLDEWLNNPNKHGLPKPNITQGGLYYWCPMKDNNSVAWFYAGSDWVFFYCNRYPGDSNSSLGVRACAEGSQKLRS